MKYKCIKGFLIDEYDDNGAFAEKQIPCEKDSTWETDEIANRFIGDKDTVRLIEISNKDNFRWMEISKEMLAEYFESDVEHEENKTKICDICNTKITEKEFKNNDGYCHKCFTEIHKR